MIEAVTSSPFDTLFATVRGVLNADVVVRDLFRATAPQGVKPDAVSILEEDTAEADRLIELINVMLHEALHDMQRFMQLHAWREAISRQLLLVQVSGSLT